MRGKALLDGSDAGRDGITPAHAGKWKVASPIRCHCQDHPRACGGKGRHLLRLCVADGITPAHAGKRKKGRRLSVYLWNHPRACGEKVTVISRVAAFWGSPPRMRGKGFNQINIHGVAGITPAHAGNDTFSRSDFFTGSNPHNRQHPHTIRFSAAYSFHQCVTEQLYVCNSQHSFKSYTQ